jgi:hypothetical protein
MGATSGADEINIGRLSIEIPAGCPDWSVFESVVREEFEYWFGNASARAAYCKSEYDRCQQVPPEFAVNRTAASRYRSAQMVLSPAAEKWQPANAGLCCGRAASGRGRDRRCWRPSPSDRRQSRPQSR